MQNQIPMLDKLNPKNLSLIRNYLPEIVIVLLTAAVVRQQFDQYAAQKQIDTIRQEQIGFEREVNTKVLTQLTQNTDAMEQMQKAIEMFLTIKSKSK